VAKPDAPGLDALKRFVNRRELQAIEESLAAGEKLSIAFQSRLDGKAGILAATNRRVLFAAAGLLASPILSVRYDDLTRCEQWQEGPDVSIILQTSGRQHSVAGLRRPEAETFVQTVRRRGESGKFRLVEFVDDPRKAEPDARPTDVGKRLQRIESMFKRGSITEPEYRVNRRRILEEAGLPTDLDEAKAAKGRR
jgi:hypothetical protein